VNAQILLMVVSLGLSPSGIDRPGTLGLLDQALFGPPADHFLRRVEPVRELSSFGWPSEQTNGSAVWYVIRGQNSSPYDEQPGTGTPAPGYVSPSPWLPGTPVNPFLQPPPQDPFLAPPGAPPAAMPWGGMMFGATGPQPFRFGWMGRVDVGYIPNRSADDANGDFGVFETDVELKYTAPVLPGIIGSLAPQFNYRAWDGPLSVPNPGGGFSSLPGSAYRIGLDVILQTPANAPWSALIAFNPSVNSDFKNSVTGDAWQWDGRGMLFWRVTPQWMLVGGAGFLDRVNDRVIPYAGFVFIPNDIWEFRILYPESRISLFLGNYWGWSYWLYARGEYHIEAYEIDNELLGQRDRVELEDYRLLIGLKTDAFGLSGYVEVGWILGRDIDYGISKATFHPGTGFIVRGGVRF